MLKSFFMTQYIRNRSRKPSTRQAGDKVGTLESLPYMLKHKTTRLSTPMQMKDHFLLGTIFR